VHNRCHGALKLFWWLVVAQRPIKTLYVAVSLILAVTCIQSMIFSIAFATQLYLRQFSLVTHYECFEKDGEKSVKKEKILPMRFSCDNPDIKK
jgi:hypothetical protein